MIADTLHPAMRQHIFDRMEDSFSSAPSAGSDTNQHQVIENNQNSENIEEDLSDASEQNNSEETEEDRNENPNSDGAYYTAEQQLQLQQQRQQQQQIFHYQHQQLLQQQHMAALQHMNQAPNSNLSHLQLQQNQIAMAATSYGLPMHIMARMSQLPAAQQQQFHIQHQLYIQKLQQLQQAQARGQMIPPAQLQMLEGHRHYLALLVGGFQPTAQQLQQFQQQQQVFQLQPQQHPGQSQPQQASVQLMQPNQYQQQVQNYHIQQINAQAHAQAQAQAIPHAGSNPNIGNIKGSSGAWKGTGDLTPIPITHSYAFTLGTSANSQHHMVPLMSTVTSLHEAHNQIHARSDAFVAASNHDRVSPVELGLQAIPPGLSFSNAAFRPIQAGQESISYKEQAQKIPLPPWLQAHGEKRHSEKQLQTHADLTKTKKKYRMSLCLYCAKVFPHSPWATLKSRKFEHEIFRKHEKSSLHQRALIELNKSAACGKPTGSGPNGNSIENPSLVPGGHFLLDISTARSLNATEIMKKQQWQQQLGLKQLQKQQLDQKSTLQPQPQTQSDPQTLRTSGSKDSNSLSDTAATKRRRSYSSNIHDTVPENRDFDVECGDDGNDENDNVAYGSDSGEIDANDRRDHYNKDTNYYPDSVERLSSPQRNLLAQQTTMGNNQSSGYGNRNVDGNGHTIDDEPTTGINSIKSMGRHITVNMLPPPVKLSTAPNAHFPLALLNHHAPLLSVSSHAPTKSALLTPAPQQLPLFQPHQQHFFAHDNLHVSVSSRNGPSQDLVSPDVGTTEHAHNQLIRHRHLMMLSMVHNPTSPSTPTRYKSKQKCGETSNHNKD